MSPPRLPAHQAASPRRHVCPWWCCFTFDNALRRLFQHPGRIVGPYVGPGFTVLDVGPGMGYFTVPLARLVGGKGKVIAADLQQRMLDAIARKARRAGVRDRIELRRSTPGQIGVDEPLDFCLAFWMVHEVPDRSRFFEEISSRMKHGGLMLVAEPKWHVSKKSLDQTLEAAGRAGLSVAARPAIFLSNAALLRKY
jgi:2-polyprenyl-3-methyl-5-hydroxy-6-metoxy-1,4-benzoquinol methylase